MPKYVIAKSFKKLCLVLQNSVKVFFKNTIAIFFCSAWDSLSFPLLNSKHYCQFFLSLIDYNMC